MAAHITPKWYNAAIPILIVILGTLAGLIYTGWNATVWADETIGFSKKLSHVIGASDSYGSSLVIFICCTGCCTFNSKPKTTNSAPNKR